MILTHTATRPLTIAATGERVAPGEDVEVTGDLAKALLAQSDLWKRTDQTKTTTKTPGDAGDAEEADQ